jgi:hypothetical protein
MLPEVMVTQCADRAHHAQVAGTTTTVVSLVNSSSREKSYLEQPFQTCRTSDMQVLTGRRIYTEVNVKFLSPYIIKRA